MSAVKPEIVIITALCQMDMKFQRVGHFSRTAAASQENLGVAIEDDGN
jgi:hypothetical protein